MVLREDAAVSQPPDGELATATLGMGCFWGPDARFGALTGVRRTRVGYAGGSAPDPTYYSLGDHTEVVQLDYDPAKLSYEEILDVFWTHHDPFSASKKCQYRNVVLVHDQSQRRVAERTRDELKERTGQSVTTQIESFDDFTLAEAYHQKYELRSTPIIGDELEERYGDAFVDSTIVTRLNGFVAGHGDETQRRELLAELDLSPAALSEVHRRL